jgi:thiamine pyrophosphate-dependent acetolactate synthase large subunit-like protein
MSKGEDLIITKNSDLYTGAQFLCNALVQSGISHVYGGHGGAVVALIDAIVAHPSLTWVYTRCETNASQMAGEVILY